MGRRRSIEIIKTVLAVLVLIFLPAFSFSDDAEHHDSDSHSDSHYDSSSASSDNTEHSDDETLFEQTFTRGRGEPTTEKVRFEIHDPEKSYKVLITNGNADGSSRCSSAVVNLNGTVIAGPADLNRNVPYLVRYPELGKTNTLKVTLNSAPGSFLKITVSKRRRADTTPPRLTVSTLSDNSWTNIAILNVSGLASDDIGLGQILINGSAVTVARDGSFSYQLALADGPNTVTVTASDLAGNIASDTRTINLDRIAPAVTLATPVDTLKTNQTPVPLAGSVNEQTEVSVMLNGGAPEAALMSGTDFSKPVLPVYGLNTIEVKATDRAGNISSVMRTVTFDDRAPQLVVLDPPQDLITNQASMLLIGTVSDLTVASVTVSVDGNTNTAAVINERFELPLNFTAEKGYPVIVRAIDEAGNEAVIQRNIIYDITSAEVLLAPLASPTNLDNQTISGTVEAGAVVTVSCPTAAVGSMAYPTSSTWTVSLSGMAEGVNEVVVVAVDQAGNAGIPITDHIILDTTAPVVKLEAPSAGSYINSSSAAVSGTLTDATSAVVYVNGIEATVSGGTFNLPALVLNEGPNSISAVAVDAVGNTSSDEIMIISDTVAPVVRITSPVSGSYTNRDITAVTGTVSDATSTIVTVNGIAATIADGTFSIPSISLNAGSNLVRVIATDAAGNTSSDEIMLISDTIAPVVRIISPVNGSYTNRNITAVSGTVSDATATIVTINGLAATVVDGTFSIPSISLNAGSNLVRVVATDAAGNTSIDEIMIISDTVAPVVRITSPVNGSYTNRNITAVSGTVSDATATSVTVNGIAATIADGTFSVPSISLNAGSNLLRVTATDAAGNTSTDEIMIISDTVAPQVSIDSPPDGMKTNSRALQVSGSAGDNLGVDSVRINGLPVTLTNGRFVYELLLAEGPNSITAEAFDMAGNRAASVVSITLDTQSPSAPVTDALPATTNLAALTISGTAEPKAVIRVANGPETTSDATGRFAVEVALVSDMMNILTLTAIDEAGNQGDPATVMIMQDSVSPAVTGFRILADPKVTLLIPLELTFSEQPDPATVNSSTITVNGPTGPVSGTYSVTGSKVIFTPSAELPANRDFVVTVSQGLKDLAGNSLSAVFSAGFDTVRGPAFILGEVYDDTTGLPIENMQVQLNKINNELIDPVITGITDRQGRFVLQFQGVTGEALIEISGTDYTRSLRKVSVSPNVSSRIFDARLTPLVKHAASSVAGADIMLEGNRLTLPASAFPSDTEISLAVLSQQGLGLRLPVGWSPVFGMELQTGGIMPATGGQLEIKNLWGFAGGTEVVAAYLEESTASWRAVDLSFSADLITMPVERSGQYALIVPDAAPYGPLLPQISGDLILPSAGTVPAGAEAEVQVLPPAVITSAEARAVTRILVTTPTAIASGTAVEASITETSRLTSGEVITKEQFSQDITLYAWPQTGRVNTLGAAFVVTPSEYHALGSLSYGRVGIDISWPETNSSGGVVIGDEGGRASTSDGAAIIVGPSALSGDTAFSVFAVSASDLPDTGSSLTYVGGLMLSIDGAGFRQDAFPQFIVPGLAAAEGSRLIAARAEPINGLMSLRAVATATVTNGKIVIDSCLSHHASPITHNCLSTGRYGFYLPLSGYGLVTGQAFRAGQPLGRAIISSDRMPFKALTDSSGGFLLPVLAGSFVVTAEEAGTGALATVSGSVGAGQTTTITVQLEATGFKVAAVSPFDKETAVSTAGRVTVTLSSAVDPATVSAASFSVSEPVFPSGKKALPGRLMLSSQNRTIVFVPDTALKPDTYYYVKLISMIKDSSGNALAPFESVFTTSGVLGNNALEPGLLKVSMPDAEGYVTVRGGPGVSPAGQPVTVINDTKNIVLEVVSGTDGSFTGRLVAELSDELIVQMTDLLGNVISLSPGLYQNEDGTAAVGPKGGTIYGPGGIRAMVPEGAYDELVTLKLGLGTAEDISTINIHPEMRNIGMVYIEANADSKEEIKISMPAPDWITEEHQVVVGEVTEERGVRELMLACPAVLKAGNGQTGRMLESTSPPFRGIWTHRALESATKKTELVMNTWTAPDGGAGYELVEVFNDEQNSFVMGGYNFVLPVHRLELVKFPILVPVNEIISVDIVGIDGTVRKSIDIQGPPQRGTFTGNVTKVSFDSTPPSVFTSTIPDGSSGVLLADNIVIEMSEALDPASINQEKYPDAVIVKDAKGNRIEGTFYLASDGKTIVFTPRYGYQYATDYSITLKGIKDPSGNAIEPYTSNFRTFEPMVFGTVGGITKATAVDRYTGRDDGREYMLVVGEFTDTSAGGMKRTGLIVADVTDPEAPVYKGAVATLGDEWDVKALPDFSFTDRDGNPVTGDFAVVVSGSASSTGQMLFVNVTDPTHPKIYEFIYLSWNPITMYDWPLGVPAYPGIPFRVALLGNLAFISTTSVGLHTVDLAKLQPPHTDAQLEAIVNTYEDPTDYPPSFRGVETLVGKTKNLVLATSIGMLTVLSPITDQPGGFSMELQSRVTDLNGPFEITATAAFPLDVDEDGNLGEFEDKDGDQITAAQETFDLVFVSTLDGVVIFNLNDPKNPVKLSVISTGNVRPNKVVVNHAKRLAYVTVADELWAISLKSYNELQGLTLRDKNKDLRDDRVISAITGMSTRDLVFSKDGDFLYGAGIGAGTVTIVDLGGEKTCECSDCRCMLDSTAGY